MMRLAIGMTTTSCLVQPFSQRITPGTLELTFIHVPGQIFHERILESHICQLQITGFLGKHLVKNNSQIFIQREYILSVHLVYLQTP